MKQNEKIIWNVTGGQVNVASGNATINATQNNTMDADRLNNLITCIKENLSDIDKESADSIIEVVDDVKAELEKPEPGSSRLKNCLTVIAPMITVANGVPVLMNHLQQLQEFIMQYI